MDTRELNPVITIQPIITRDDEGNDPARCQIEEELISGLYAAAGVDVVFLDAVHFDNTQARDGLHDVELVLDDAREAGLLKGDGEIANMFFVNAINGRPAPCGLSQTPGWLSFIAMAEGRPQAEEAFVIAHELGHNLGLIHAVDDPKVPDDVPNIMGDGEFEDRVAPTGLIAYQVEIIRGNPLAVPIEDEAGPVDAPGVGCSEDAS